MSKLLMGNQAIAQGAIDAGVNFVCGYPGTPSTEFLESVAKNNDGSIYVEWSVNEKVALEVGAGAAYSGARTLVTMKQVGLNVASDPLMSLAYIGVKGGMVILVADDPGPISSQTEQDTRHFGIYSKLPVFDPSTPEEAYEMVFDAFEMSEKYNIPVFLRPTTRVCHGCSSVSLREEKIKNNIQGFIKDPNFVIFPPLSFKRHKELEEKAERIAKDFSKIKYNYVLNTNEKENVIVTNGVTYAYVKEAADNLNLNAKIIKLGCSVPFPEDFVLENLKECKNVLVLEELDPVIEEFLNNLKGKENIKFNLLGKRDKTVPYAGELSVDKVREILAKVFNVENQIDVQNSADLPMRPPVLCAGCPHRASFYAVKDAMKNNKCFFTGDIGCYTLGNAKPLDMVDTCLCMGAGVTIAQGLSHVNKDTHVFAFIGDSTFFHSGITGLVNALYNKVKMTIVILDNSTTAMTGHQPHPGTGKTMMGEITEKINIKKVVEGCGVSFVKVVDPLDQDEAKKAAKEAYEFNGLSVIIYKSPCIALVKSDKKCEISDKCIKCKKCINSIGCPAISIINDKVIIDKSLCTGCGLCKSVCPVKAIN